MLIPPDVQRRFVNTSTEPLEMVMIEWPANAIARKDILVRDVTLLPFCEENAHWNNMSKCVFTQADGMTGRVLLVMLMPMTMAAPHTHGPGTDEIWTKITPGNALTLLGSELREMPQYSAFLAPPNGHTVARAAEYVEDAGGDVAVRGRRQRRRRGAASSGPPAQPARRRRRWRRSRRRPRRRQSESVERSGGRRSGQRQRQAAQVALRQQKEGHTW